MTAERAADKLPPAIAVLRAELADLPAVQALTALEAHLGPPTRDVGSGLSLPVWELAEGTVRYLQRSGVVFVDRGGRRHWLTRSRTTARVNLLRSFEVDTLPDPANRGTTSFVGTLAITAEPNGLRYRYTAARPGQSSASSARGESFFFAVHPDGPLRLAWSRGIGDDTALEPQGDATLGSLTFVGEGGDLAAEIRSSATGRTLQLVAPAPALGATLSVPWRSAWSSD